MTQTDERERDTWTRRPPMTKQEKLELIRQMRTELHGEPKQESE
jgi:hypothetical protein